MKPRIVTAIVLGGTLVVLSNHAPASAQGDKTLSLNSLSLEVGALQTLFQFSFTKGQLEKLQQLSTGTAAKEPKRKAAKASKEYRDKLEALRLALLDSKNEQRVQKLNDELARMRDKEKPTFDDRVDMTEPARKRAQEAFRMLKPAQLAFYLGSIAGDIADPTDRLIQSLDEVRGMTDEEWKEQKDEIADDIGRLTAGLDAAKSKPVSDQPPAVARPRPEQCGLCKTAGGAAQIRPQDHR
jgi:hypothetical protein